MQVSRSREVQFVEVAVNVVVVVYNCAQASSKQTLPQFSQSLLLLLLVYLMNVVQNQKDEDCSRWSRLLIIVAFKLGDRIIGDFQLEASFLSLSLSLIQIVFKLEKRNQGCLLEVAHQKRASFSLRFWAANCSFLDDHYDGDHTTRLLTCCCCYCCLLSILHCSILVDLSLSLTLKAGFECGGCLSRRKILFA